MALRPVGGRECCGGPPGGKGWEKREAEVGEPLRPGSPEKTASSVPGKEWRQEAWAPNEAALWADFHAPSSSEMAPWALLCARLHEGPSPSV